MDLATPDELTDAIDAQMTSPDVAQVTPVILCGGTGMRLWPVSRESYPKPFWPLASDRSLIEETARRAMGVGCAPPIVVCNQEHRFLVAEQMRLAGISNPTILLEPVGRDSAPAVAAAALLIAESNPDAVLWIMAADAVITDVEAQHEALRHAVRTAADGLIVTFGMRPSSPETAYGYIETGETIDAAGAVHAVRRFIEKPDAATATRLCASGRHLWNSGMFVATSRTLLSELARHAPDVLEAVQKAVADRRPDLGFIRLEAQAFALSPKISIDHAVAERTTRCAVVPADFGWSDVGSWDALWGVTRKDAEGNAAIGDVTLQGARDCYIRSEGILTAVVGLRDVVVVSTKDAVLVMDRHQAQSVKNVVETLRRDARPEAVSHSKVWRPWGFFESLIQGDRFQVKRIVVNPGQRLSLQKHYHRAEHWVVVSGSALVTRDHETILINENESIYLPLGCVHRLDNPGRIPLTLIEVQSGSYLGEDDIVRLEDTYGRIESAVVVAGTDVRPFDNAAGTVAGIRSNGSSILPH
jgi:mannose-1-phosphate guanylyltransferase / mannose-6-phosphate isomerase